MDDAGDTAQAAAMSVCIIAIGLAVRLAYWALMRRVSRRTQAWREPAQIATVEPETEARAT
jgi:iron(III) transport system permease protein